MQIKELVIFSAGLDAQVRFYSEILGVKIIRQSEEKISLDFGRSVLTIVQEAASTPYHFAVNIPSNMEAEALDWLKARVEILKDGQNEIQDFDFWNAKAMYFYDEDKNIVELIARKNLNTHSDREFGPGDFLEISEIGIPTSNIEKQFNALNRIAGVEIFDGGFERFCAVGDEHGLFICINKEIKDWFPTGDKAFSSPFEIELVQKGVTHHLGFKDEVLSPLAKGV